MDVARMLTWTAERQPSCRARARRPARPRPGAFRLLGGAVAGWLRTLLRRKRAR